MGVGWSEIFVVAMVALLVFGPTELPQAMRTVARILRQARVLRSEFDRHFRDALRELDLEGVTTPAKKPPVRPTASVTPLFPDGPRSGAKATGGETPPTSPAVPPGSPPGQPAAMTGGGQVSPSSELGAPHPTAVPQSSPPDGLSRLGGA